MDRDTYLQSVWTPYPAAEPDWVDVADFLRMPNVSAVVCGRIHRLNSHLWCLASDGGELRVSMGEKPEGAAFILRDGDLVALKLEEKGVNEFWRVKECQLLVPAQETVPVKVSISHERSREWMMFLDEVRAFFRERGFIEVLTPTLVPSPGTEPFLDPFQTEVVFGEHRRETRYLPTSPEFHLKKMLSAGWTKIFEIKTCFRNAESGAHHQLEFQMLEWYRAYATLDAIASDVEDLAVSLVKRFRPEKPAISKMERITMADLFSQAFNGFTLKPETSREELLDLAEREGVRASPSDTWDEVFFRLFLERIEPGLGMKAPVLVRDYPASQAALSRIGKNGFADRFEIYWRGLEIANAFHELNDPKENEARFKEDAMKKKALGKPAVPVDRELVAALRYGMPPSGGIALGLERLFMALFEIESIDETRPFPYRG